MPGIFADRHSDADAAEVERACQRSPIKDPDFVEYRLVRQVALEIPAHDAAILEYVKGVVELPVLTQRPADPECRTICTGHAQRVESCLGVAHKRWPHHEILSVVARDEHLGQHHQVGTSRTALLPCGTRQRGIADKIPRPWGSFAPASGEISLPS